MIDESIEVVFYVDGTGVSPYETWLESLKDLRGKAAIDVRINRLLLANLGDCKFVSKGVHELRTSYGPGYRVYFGKIGKRVRLLQKSRCSCRPMFLPKSGVEKIPLTPFKKGELRF